MLLEHKKAVIYGAAGAIGGAVARSFAHEGADLVLAGRTRARVESVADEISAAGGVAEAAEIDALDEDAIEKHMDDVVARAQRIDVLFNALGMDDVQGTLLVDMSAEDFAQPVIKATRTSSSPCARRRGGWSGKGPGWSCPSPWLPPPVPHHGSSGSRAARSKGCSGVSPRSSDHTGSGSSSRGRPGLRTRQTSSRPSSITPGPPGSPEKFLAEASSGTLLRRLPMLSEVAEAAVMMASDRASAMTGVMANVTCGFWVDV